MSYINYTCRYNKRHKIVIAIIAVIVLLLQWIPYVIIKNELAPADHMECVEISKQPTCASEKGFFAYEVNKERTEIKRIPVYKTCYDYYKNDNLQSIWPEWFYCLGGLFTIVEAFALFIAACYGLITGIAAIFKWLCSGSKYVTTVEEDEVTNVAEEPDWTEQGDSYDTENGDDNQGDN